MAIRSTSATLVATARAQGRARRDWRASTQISVKPVLTAFASVIQNSQAVYLTFRLDRTSIPYTAQRR